MTELEKVYLSLAGLALLGLALTYISDRLAARRKRR